MKRSLCICLLIALSFQAMSAVPDSLLEVRQKMILCLNDARDLSQAINTPSDLYNNETQLKLLETRMDNLKNRYPEIFDNKELYRIFEQYNRCMDGIKRKVEANQSRLLLDSLRLVMEMLSPTFDSLLDVGIYYADHKYGDSVRMVKRKAEDLWQQTHTMHESNPSIFSSDEELKDGYGHISYIKGEIADLSEKERIKIKDLIIVVGVAIAAVSMVAGMVGTRIRSRKLMKSDDTNFQI